MVRATWISVVSSVAIVDNSTPTTISAQPAMRPRNGCRTRRTHEYVAPAVESDFDK